jgi:hypothetical protein
MYRRQRFWQIILPIVLVSLLVVVAGGITISVEADLNRLWADISIIWLVLPVLLIALLFLIILIGMIYLMYKLTNGLPRLTRKAQNIFIRIEQETCRGSNSVAKPVIWIHQFQSGLKRMLRIINPVQKEGKNYGTERTIDTN